MLDNNMETICDMTSNDIIQILKEDIIQFFKNSKFHHQQEYILKNYKFEELLFDIMISNNVDIKHDDEEDLPRVCYILKITIPSSWKGFCYTNLLIKPSHSLEEALHFLLTRLREDYEYSKVVDGLYRYDAIEAYEKISIAKQILLNGYNDEKTLMEENKCCVCLDFTLVKSKCGHHLCRFCFDKIRPTIITDEDGDEVEGCKCCPICRTCF